MTEVFYNYSGSNGQAGTPKPEDAAKIFVGGLSWDTTQEKLSSYFSQFGEVVDCILMMDTTTKRSRGFGFVTYKDPMSVNRVLESCPHILDNKSIDPKAAVPRNNTTTCVKSPTVQGSPGGNRKCNKIFVGGIGQATEDDLRAYFGAYGQVTDVTIMIDKNTHRPRGFAFVGFENSDSSEQTANIRYHLIKGKRVEVKVAQPRDAKNFDFSDDLAKSEMEMVAQRSEMDSGSDPISEMMSNVCGNSEIKHHQLTNESIAHVTKIKIVQLLNDIWK